LSLILFPQKVEERETFIVRWLRRFYGPALQFVLANRIITFAGLALIALLAIVAVRSLGLEFLPKLEEGNLWVRATFPQSISLEDSDTYVNRMRVLMAKFPEVQSVVSQHGRPDDGTDATGFFNAEFFVPLKPFDAWPSGTTKEKLTQEMTDSLQDNFPGVDFNFSQYIQDNVEEAASGVKGENSVKVYGNDLETLEKTADSIAAVLAKVPGITDLAVLRSLGQPTIRIDVDRLRAARYGLAPGDVNAVVQTAIGGQSAGDLYEGSSDRHFPMMVRLAAPFRQSLDAIRHIPIAAAAGAAASGGAGVIQISLQDVADVRLLSGAAFIYREQQQRYVPIKFSVRGRDLGSAVLEAQHAVDSSVLLPGGYRLEWVGEFGNLQEAIARLGIAVPLSLALIVLLLYLNFSSLRDALLAASVIPMALLGGVLALWVSGTAFSVSSAIGFVALFGIAAMDGILILSYYHLSLDSGLNRTDAMLQTCRTQLRPVMLTCIVACVGLIPAAFSTGIGSQVQRPLAIVVVGGMLLAPVLILLVLPVLILKFSRAQELPEELPREAGT
jgi:cobalt-zinc-cadmium resistance protein CzcA